MVSLYSGGKVLVAGGAGMIGSEIVQELLKRGARVRIAQHVRPQPFGNAVEVVGTTTKLESSSVYRRIFLDCCRLTVAYAVS